MGEKKTPVERAMDVFVYAPIGLLVSARDVLPSLAEKGREAITNARAMGEFALGMGQEEANKVIRGLFPDQRRDEGPPSRLSVSEPAPAPPADAHEPVLRAVPAPAATTLAIPGYDALSASQVVPRLESLSAPELEAVRVYEEAGRGRKTVLSRIAQLQAG